jgi:AraC-like DNA-binding protein
MSWTLPQRPTRMGGGVPLHDVHIPEPYLLTTAVIGSEPAATLECHAHREGMLIWGVRGSSTAIVDGQPVMLTAGSGVWLPPYTPHTVQADGSAVAGCTYFAPEIAPDWDAVEAVAMPVAVRELLLHLAKEAMPDHHRLRAQRLISELLPERGLPLPAALPEPTDRRIAELVRTVTTYPADALTLEEWAWRLALSSRTLSRIFAHDVGMSFAQWRTLVRMAAARRFLLQGLPVSIVAQRVGYTTSSAFGVAFRRETGQQPSAWLENHLRSVA